MLEVLADSTTNPQDVHSITKVTDSCLFHVGKINEIDIYFLIKTNEWTWLL